MTDLDRYLTDEMIEQAAQALHDRLSMECGALHEVGQPLGDAVYDNDRRADARAALTAAAPLIAAQALRDAADKYQTGGWADDLPAGGSRPALILGMSQRAVAWLRARAEAWDEGHLAGHEDARAVQPTYPQPTRNPYADEHDACCPHPKCPGGGLCCCLPEQGGQP